MKDSIRCCISCILPCGALDVIRIVHASGRVEEIGGGRIVLADEIMRAYPKHVLRKPPSSYSFEDEGGGGGDGPRGPVVLPPDAELHRGNIYFLMPVLSATAAPARRRKKNKSITSKSKSEEENVVNFARSSSNGGGGGATEVEEQTRMLMSDRYLSEILSEKVSTQRDRRRGRVGVWRPHLESISEILNND